MNPMTDDELDELLSRTFTAHEHLADPERAVTIAAPRERPRHSGRVLLVSAAAVAVLVGGTSYAVSRGSGSVEAGPTTSHPTTSGNPPLPPLQTDAENRAAAVAEAVRVAAALPDYPGAQETDQAGVPELGDDTLSAVHPSGHTIVRSRFWTVRGVASKTVAQWYAAHPLPGFRSEGGVGGEGDGSRWINEAYWDPAGGTALRPMTSVEIETTNTSEGAAIRVTVSSVWPPARPLASFVQDVSSIDVRSIHRHYGRQLRTEHRAFTVTAPSSVLRAATAYNALPGMTPILMSCPMAMDDYTDRIVFHTATGDVTAVSNSGACGAGMSVRRDGHRVDPQLGDAPTLLHVLGLDH